MANVFTQKPVPRQLDKEIGTLNATTAVSLEKEEHLSAEEQSYVDREVKTRPIKFQQFKKGSKGGGLVLSVLAAHKFGKSIWAVLWAYYNSKYKDHKDFPEGVRKLLSTGALPEITKVKVIDTEGTWERDLRHGTLCKLTRPLIDDGVIEVVTTPLKRKREGIDSKSGEVVNLKDIDIDNDRQNFEAAVWEGVAEADENTLVICDSISDYKGSLDDLQAIMFKKTIITSYKQTKGVTADAKSQEALRAQFNQYRNKWWHNTLIKVRSANSWAITTIKLGETDDRFREEKDDQGNVTGMRPKYYPIWCARTQYRIDNGYTIMDYFDLENATTSTVLRFDWGKYEHKSAKPYDRINDEARIKESFLPYHQNKKFAMMRTLDDMSASLLGEETVEEEANSW